MQKPPSKSPSFEGHDRYPTNLAEYNCFTTDGEALSKRLSTSSSELFCSSGDGINVDVFDVDGYVGVESPKVSHLVFSQTRGLEEYLADGAKSPRIRVISIAQKDTLAPLRITEETMRKVLTNYQVMPDFLSFIFACGNHPQASDTGSRGFVTNCRSNGAREIMYLYKYAEQNQRKKNPWSIRQTVIYQQISPEGSHLWIVLHPKINSLFHARLQSSLTQPESVIALGRNPWNLHILLISSYTDNWRWYLKPLGEEFADTADVALITDLEEDYQVSFKTLQSLRNLYDKICLASACLHASIGVVKDLRSAEPKVNAFDSFLSQLQGNINSTESLRKRVQGILHLLTETLNFKSQITAEKSNKHMLGLTRETVDDSATVRVIGIVTLIYLPSTFVATLFGMNFFKFRDQMPNLEIAQDFWIFLTLAIPLTGLTIAFWIILLWRKRNRKATRSNTAPEGIAGSEV